MSQEKVAAPHIDFNEPRLKRHRSLRALKDKVARVAIGTGGFTVIAAITMIFFYLLYEVAPLFQSASVDKVTEYPVPAAELGETLYIGLEEQAEKGIRVTREGQVVFFNTQDGSLVSSQRLPIPEGVQLTRVEEAGIGDKVLAAGTTDGGVLVFEQEYAVSYPEDRRVITPGLLFPYGQEPFQMDTGGRPITQVSIRDDSNGLFVVAANDEHQLFSRSFDKRRNFLTGAITLTASEVTMPRINGEILGLALSPSGRWLYVGTEEGKLDMFDLRDPHNPKLNSRIAVTASGAEISELKFLLGGTSLLIADTEGNLTQWFPVRNDKNQYALEKIRRFEHDGGTITQIIPEHRRKGFAALDVDGNLALYYSTANRRTLEQQIGSGHFHAAALAPRGNFALLETPDGKLMYWSVDNKHPEISWSSLWGKVWYEGYDEPKHIWQSSAANDDFEPKYSLTPLAFGTLKAAFYAMLIATPLAIAGAVYTAYFMAPKVRRKVKPAIELMEALPTVILGFLAGLFFAPFMESNLPGVFAVLILVPIAILLFAFAWVNLPERIRHLLPEGWEAFLLIPVIILTAWLAFQASDYMEVWFFGGDVRHWLRDEFGLGFNQRNALVVGVAMGFAVIPTIFSITEDAVFSVPKHLSYGSLALGATPWQTMVRVVLPTASPAIFSAVMIGMGRAVGETMIVLMATGNTPIMDMNIFEGMRTLSANIAVEMPESAVGSSHYRILFLAAFVLFLFTFVVNTLAESVRQRLRKKYSVI